MLPCAEKRERTLAKLVDPLVGAELVGAMLLTSAWYASTSCPLKLVTSVLCFLRIMVASVTFKLRLGPTVARSKLAQDASVAVVMVLTTDMHFVTGEGPCRDSSAAPGSKNCTEGAAHLDAIHCNCCVAPVQGLDTLLGGAGSESLFTMASSTRAFTVNVRRPLRASKPPAATSPHTIPGKFASRLVSHGLDT